MAERAVNKTQLDVLKWIIDGCPSGVMTGFTYKATALALQTRRLVRVSKRGGVWRAEPTDAGRYFAEHGAYPPGHWNRSTTSAATETAETGRDSVAPSTPRPRPAPSRATAVRPVDQVLADVVAAGGELHVTRDRGGYYERLVATANRHGKVPDGKLLEVATGATWKEQIVRLIDKPAWMTGGLPAIAVGDRLRNTHPVVKALRDDKDQLAMKPAAVRNRALRMLNALAREATRRGYPVRQATAKPGYRYAKGHLQITISGHDYTICVDELHDRVPHVPTASELREQKRYSWVRIPTHDRVPSGRLRLQILDGCAVRQEKFADTKTIDLADRLPLVLQEVELRAAAAEERRLQREREEAERERQWRQVLEEAKVELREHHRGTILMEQLERWRHAHDLDDYIDAMTSHALALTGEDRDAADQWIAWAREYRQNLDPLNQPLALPADPDFSAEALKPFMRGWSIYGPHRGIG